MSALSHIGRRRATNEDAFLVTERLWAVADGVAGGPGGEVAARLAIDALAYAAYSTHTAADLERAAQAAAADVHAAGHRDPSLTGLATTLTAALMTPDGLAVVHAGDSRLYRLRRGRLERLTDDHTFTDQLVREGLMAPERAAAHPLRNLLTRALGRDPDEHEIEAIVASTHSLDEATIALVDAANAAGGSDNITVVLGGAPAAATVAVAA